MGFGMVVSDTGTVVCKSLAGSAAREDSRIVSIWPCSLDCRHAWPTGIVWMLCKC